MSKPVVRSFRYGDELIRFTVRSQVERKARRIAIHIEPDGSVVVDAPADATGAAVLAAVQRRANWLSRHLAALRERGVHVLPREYVSGESLLYLGRRYQLKVVVDEERRGTARMRGGHIEVAVGRHDPETVRVLLEAWYLHRARDVLGARLEAIVPSLTWVRQVPAMGLRVMKRQWGSCSPTGRLTLNPHLVKAPRECIDYVIVHELCHLIAHNHGPHFYRALDAHMPAWRELKKRLDALADQLMPWTPATG